MAKQAKTELFAIVGNFTVIKADDLDALSEQIDKSNILASCSDCRIVAIKGVALEVNPPVNKLSILDGKDKIDVAIPSDTNVEVSSDRVAQLSKD